MRGRSTTIPSGRSSVLCQKRCRRRRGNSLFSRGTEAAVRRPKTIRICQSPIRSLDRRNCGYLRHPSRRGFWQIRLGAHSPGRLSRTPTRVPLVCVQARQRVVYRSGFVKRLQEAASLPAITFETADLPEDVVALGDAHLLDLGGTYDVPEAGRPDPVRRDTHAGA